MQSRFWQGDASSSDSESSGRGEDAGQKSLANRAAVPAAAGRWANVESSSDEETHVVRSVIDKQTIAIENCGRKIAEKQKVADFSAITEEYENLQRTVKKANYTGEPPKAYLRVLISLEDYIAAKVSDREAYKKLTKARATALNTLRARVRKGNQDIAESITAARDNKDLLQDSDAQSSDDDDDEDSSSDTETASDSPDEDEDHEDSSDDDAEADSESSASSYWAGDSDDDSSSSDVSVEEEGEFEDKHQRALHRWGVKATDKDKVKVPKVKERTTKTTVVKKKDKGLPSTGPAQTSNTALSTAISGLQSASVDADLLTRTVSEIMAQRGRKGTDRTEFITTLQQLVELAAAVGPQSTLEMLGHLISGYFDINLGAFACLSAAYWLEAHKHLSHAVTLISDNPNLTFGPVSYLADRPSVVGSRQQSEKSRTAALLAGFVVRLDDELTKALQFVDVHSDDYKPRLRNSIDLLALLWRAYIHLRDHNMPNYAGVMVLRILEQTYYRPLPLSCQTWELVRQLLPEEIQTTLPHPMTHESAQKVFDDLVEYAMANADNARARIRACLHRVYNLAIGDKYSAAKEICYGCNMHDMVMQSDVFTQILFNRCIAQLGLCAFRHGLIADAHSCLSELCAMNRHRELLAQGVGVMKNQEKAPDHERDEKLRLLPYHMHISLELIEGVHNICAMLLEVPLMASRTFNNETHVVSRQFRRLLEASDRQPFVGPPENARETVVAATRALQNGDAALCCKYIFQLHIWNNTPNSEAVKEMIQEKVKTEALRTYLFKYSSVYHSFSLKELTAMFDLPPRLLHAIICKMMIKEELLASWDETSQFVLIKRVDPTPLQVLMMQLADRVLSSVDQNELLLNFKNPRYAVQQQDQRGGRRFQEDYRMDRGDRGGQRWYNRGDYTRNAPGQQNLQRGVRPGSARPRVPGVLASGGLRSDWSGTAPRQWQAGAA